MCVCVCVCVTHSARTSACQTVTHMCMYVCMHEHRYTDTNTDRDRDRDRDRDSDRYRDTDTDTPEGEGGDDAENAVDEAVKDNLGGQQAPFVHPHGHFRQVKRRLIVCVCVFVCVCARACVRAGACERCVHLVEVKWCLIRQVGVHHRSITVQEHCAKKHYIKVPDLAGRCPPFCTSNKAIALR